MSKRKHPSEDGVLLPNSLIATIISFLQVFQDIIPEQANDVAAIHQATEYKSIPQAADAVGVDADERSPAHVLSLKDTSGNKSLDPKFEYVLEKFQTSRYTKSRQNEALSRTILDIIFLDRLEGLQDQNGYYQVQLDPEMNISVIADGADIKETIRGRMDWALNYDVKNRGSILVVWEAKRAELGAYGLPQLLVYMAGVLQSRHDRINQTVWGMASDSITFQFAFLDHKKKFYACKIYQWLHDQSTVLAYIDAILFDAVQSSPHTTSTKTGNAILRNYSRHLKTRWQFGKESEDKAVNDVDSESIVNVFMEKKIVGVKPAGKKEAEINKEAEAVSKGEA